jgi:hypothetical protein
MWHPCEMLNMRKGTEVYVLKWDRNISFKRGLILTPKQLKTYWNVCIMSGSLTTGMAK